MYDIRQVYQPKDLGEALSLLAEHPDAIVISGGTDVLIKVRERKWKDCSLLSIHRLPQLQGVRREKEELVVGPGTCFDQLHETGVIWEHAFACGRRLTRWGAPRFALWLRWEGISVMAQSVLTVRRRCWYSMLGWNSPISAKPSGNWISVRFILVPDARPWTEKGNC